MLLTFIAVVSDQLQARLINDMHLQAFRLQQFLELGRGTRFTAAWLAAHNHQGHARSLPCMCEGVLARADPKDASKVRSERISLLPGCMMQLASFLCRSSFQLRSSCQMRHILPRTDLWSAAKWRI